MSKVDWYIPKHAYGGNYLADNTAIGSGTLRDLTTAAYNTAVGSGALRDLTTSNFNTALGFKAGAGIKTGDLGNVAIGNQAMSSRDVPSGAFGGGNVAIGSKAMSSKVVSGNNNIAIGSNSMDNVTSGDNNVAIGQNALVGLSTGHKNVAMGWLALNANNGISNVGIGHQSLVNSTGDQNTAIGNVSGVMITSGSKNIAIGYSALWSSDIDAEGEDLLSSGGNYVTGDHNIAIGVNANLPSRQKSDQLSIANHILGTGFEWLTLANATSPNSPAKVGISTVPTEKLDINGNLRVRSLPQNGQQSAIYTGSNTDPFALSKTETFTATRTIVANNNGVLGYVDGLPSGGSPISIIAQNGVTVTPQGSTYDIEIGGTLTQNKTITTTSQGMLTIDGTGELKVDVPLQIPQGAGDGKVLTSDANGNATWQKAPQNWFYLPSFNLDVSSTGAKTVELYTDIYAKQFKQSTNPKFVSSNPAATEVAPVYAATDLDYFVTDYPSNITINSIDANGKMTYTVNSTTIPEGAFITVILKVK
jgi:hypothetical protein